MYDKIIYLLDGFAETVHVLGAHAVPLPIVTSHLVQGVGSSNSASIQRRGDSDAQCAAFERRKGGGTRVNMPGSGGTTPALARRPYLTESIYQLVLESQLPHKIVDLLCTETNQNIKLTVLWGS